MKSLPRQIQQRAEAAWTPEEDEMLVRRCRQGRSVFEIARLHGRELHAILERRERLGIAAHGARVA